MLNKNDIFLPECSRHKGNSIIPELDIWQIQKEKEKKIYSKFHFVGIGGCGMGALAKIILELGCDVRGSDIKSNSIAERLTLSGAKFFTGHNENNLSDADVVIYSGCIAPDNPELALARRKNIPILHRAELLAELMNNKTGIAVTGAHGKTTTTTFIAFILKQLNSDPTVVIGGEVCNLGNGAVAGKGEFVIAEADESDGSFLFLKPVYAVITNVDLEHLDYYKNIEEIQNAYAQFMNKIKPGGKLFYGGGNEHLENILCFYEGEKMSFGVSENNDVHAVDICFGKFCSEFDVVFKKRNLGRVKINAGGEHNVVNCLGALALTLDLGFDFEEIKKALELFKLPDRRCHVKSDFNNITVIDDYAHHPAEIKAFLKGIKSAAPKRIITIFQPHRYSRTKHLKEFFIESFDDADYLILTDIYSAGEAPIEGVTSRALTEEIRERKKDACFLLKEEIIGHLLNMAEEGDFILFLGAGDVCKLSDELSKHLKIRFKI
ncbi:MAG: UDP-N-acetylmuramate--L-alanine ligase [Candidatus Omnitrophota bacterium]